jgi:hypothetical protein
VLLAGLLLALLLLQELLFVLLVSFALIGLLTSCLSLLSTGQAVALPGVLHAGVTLLLLLLLLQLLFPCIGLWLAAAAPALECWLLVWAAAQARHLLLLPPVCLLPGSFAAALAAVCC